MVFCLSVPLSPLSFSPPPHWQLKWPLWLLLLSGSGVQSLSLGSDFSSYAAPVISLPKDHSNVLTSLPTLLFILHQYVPNKSRLALVYFLLLKLLTGCHCLRISGQSKPHTPGLFVIKPPWASLALTLRTLTISSPSNVEYYAFSRPWTLLPSDQPQWKLSPMPR